MARLLPPVFEARRSSAMVPSSMELYFLLAPRLGLPDELLDDPCTKHYSSMTCSLEQAQPYTSFCRLMPYLAGSAKGPQAGSFVRQGCRQAPHSAP